MGLSELQKLKNTILKLEQNNNKFIGAKDTLLKSLKEEFDFDSVKEAKTKLKKLKKEYEELNETIEQLTEELTNELIEEGIIENEENL
jgi:hypothetical protein